MVLCKLGALAALTAAAAARKFVQHRLEQEKRRKQHPDELPSTSSAQDPTVRPIIFDPLDEVFGSRQTTPTPRASAVQQAPGSNPNSASPPTSDTTCTTPPSSSSSSTSSSPPPSHAMCLYRSRCQAVRGLPSLWGRLDVCQDSLLLQSRGSELGAGAYYQAVHLLNVTLELAENVCATIASCLAAGKKAYGGPCPELQPLQRLLCLARHHLCTLQGLQHDCHTQRHLADCWVMNFKWRLTQHATPAHCQAMACSSRSWDQAQRLYYPTVPVRVLVSAACRRGQYF
ncbi:hypothetical protein WJX74_000971 [Apatococcus lobatus]|uniref:Uncharacterized protein n=1 Tax=Apatococcus lobatus TaxID=904363 RepID=A0AAW1RQ86_9CHLO